MKMSFKKIIDKIFEIGVLVKAVFGFFEILAGVFVAVAGEKLIDNFLIDLAMNEISQEPNGLIARRFIVWSTDLYLGPKFFPVFYLVFHGVVNISLIIALLKNKAWAYHWAMVGFSLFIIYQIYEYLHSYSLTLLGLTIFDIFFVLVIYLEYRKLRKKNKQK